VRGIDERGDRREERGEETGERRGERLRKGETIGLVLRAQV
jgi:hypothetical protein